MPAVSPSEGPVAVTGASGYIGAHTVAALVERGYTVRACITDATDPIKVDHLLAMNSAPNPGHVELFTANLVERGSYDRPFEGCSAVLHLGTAMGYGGKNGPREVYDGAVQGTQNVLDSVRKAGTARRFVYTSSFSAIVHPAASGYVFTEKDWAGENRERDKSWTEASIETNGEVAYAMAKVETERLANRTANEDGRFDAISVCPCVVLGPLLSTAHELVGSWQWFLARMLEGRPCKRGWQALWNIVDVRDVGEAHALILGSDRCGNGSRYQLTATDASGELDVWQLQAHLQRLFPDVTVGGEPEKMKAFLERRGRIHDGPRAHCDLAREELGLETHAIEDTLRETGQTMIDLGLVTPAFK